MTGANQLLREIPVIRRAREFHLYDSAGRRFLDLYLNNGKAILGHRPEGFSLILKNTLARGVYAEYPSHEEGKMLKSAKALWGKAFPQIRYYHSPDAFQGWLGETLSRDDYFPIADSALGEDGPFSYWRPWLPVSPKVQIIQPVLPVPGMEQGILVCAVSSFPDLPEGDLPSPVSAAGIKRCLWNLKSLLDQIADSPADTMDHLFSHTGWDRRGPYLHWTGDRKAYEGLFRSALSAGLLLSPDPDSPSIIPHTLTSGDQKILEQFFGGNDKKGDA